MDSLKWVRKYIRERNEAIEPERWAARRERHRASDRLRYEKIRRRRERQRERSKLPDVKRKKSLYMKGYWQRKKVKEKMWSYYLKKSKV